MARTKRNFKEKTHYHIYNRGNNKQKVFYQSFDKKIFLEYLHSYAKKYDIKIVGYCLMNNHYHLIIRTGVRPSNVSKFMHAFSTKFCIYINKRYKRVGHVFQGRYNASEIRSEKHLAKIKQYLRENPVKGNLVQDPEDYKWLRV